MQSKENYYGYYNSLFGNYRDYKQDVRALSQFYSGNFNLRILEIGAGTGNHTAELRARGAVTTAVEIDPGACQILNERFESDGKVKTIQTDAFSLKHEDFTRHDAAVVFYPILQTNRNESEFFEGLFFLIQNTREMEMGLVFEYMDVDIHLAKYSNMSARLPGAEDFNVTLSTTAVNGEDAKISYQGQIAGDDFNYNVDICRIEKTILTEELCRLGLKVTEYSLTTSGRRSLIHVLDGNA